MLRLCVQKEGETLRSYISRWLNLRNSIEVILTSGAEDIAGLLGCDLDKGQKILDAARASVQPQETAAS